ncbi:hypothetical protein U5A82_02760 [Sphingobium sp. CR2-8]|uniref:hypothetical protein n=1 Tax=Sphingobium sp. CR2-8 TaxID=1306534 RepID=UPI002DB73CEF|nr:hypothetical protein [Sphingobium sp. CR2-8]MEC3909430.1 hypothetical protein [Sphingobium sp. CR2-8]
MSRGKTNRLNRQRRATDSADRAELDRVLKAIKGLVTLATEGKGTRSLVDQLLELEAQEDAIRARLAAAPADVPDIHPNISEIYRRKVERFAEALAHPQERQEAADALRALIERIVLTPGAKRGEVNAMLHGEFGTILEWLEQRKSAQNDTTPGANAPGVAGMSVSVVAGERFVLKLHFFRS